MGDGRLRRRDSERLPEVVQQLEDYQEWVERNGHKAVIGRAYKRNCELLVALHEHARGINPNVGDLGTAIVEVARSAKIPLVDSTPRLLIDDRGLSTSWTAHQGKLCSINPQYVRDDREVSFKLRASA